MLYPKPTEPKHVRRTPPIVGLSNPDPASGMKKMFNKLSGSPPNSISLKDLREKLWPEGGLYRDPDGSMVILWDECKSFVRITPDHFTTHENRVKLNMFAAKHVVSFSEPILWSDALEHIKSTGAPEDVVSCIVLITETHGFKSTPPSH